MRHLVRSVSGNDNLVAFHLCRWETTLKAKKSLKIFRELLSGKFPLLPISSRMQGKSENVPVLEKNVNSVHNYFPTTTGKLLVPSLYLTLS